MPQLEQWEMGTGALERLPRGIPSTLCLGWGGLLLEHLGILATGQGPADPAFHKPRIKWVYSLRSLAGGCLGLG